MENSLYAILSILNMLLKQYLSNLKNIKFKVLNYNKGFSFNSQLINNCGKKKLKRNWDPLVYSIII